MRGRPGVERAGAVIAGGVLELFRDPRVLLPAWGLVAPIAGPLRRAELVPLPVRVPKQDHRIGLALPGRGRGRSQDLHPSW